MIACLLRDPAVAASPDDTIETIARACSPRVEPHGPDAVLFDASGLARVCGPPEVIAREVTTLAASQSIAVRIALAGTRTTAWILAHARAGVTVVAPGQERPALARLPVGWLSGVIALDHRRLTAHGSGLRAHGLRLTAAECREHLATFERWGLRTCGDVASLPRGDIHARMGPLGVRLHQAACGEDVSPLMPVDEVAPFADRMQLEWPIEGLEPLSFVLSRQFDRLSSLLLQADRGAVAVITRLTLTTREVHERVLNLPAPMRDARVLRTLVLLDLESHPPSAGIDGVEIVLEVTPGRIVQGSLLARSLPSPEDVATLLARLGALMGESRIGAPVLLDTHDTREVAMKPFRVRETSSAGSRLPAPGSRPQEPLAPLAPALHRFSLALSVRVEAERGVPVRLSSSARAFSGAVVERAGPWRTSGAWWRLDAGGWDRDEWDVQLDNGTVCRVARHRASGTWDIDGLFD